MKSDFYAGGSFYDEAHSIVTERDPEKHAVMRKQLAHFFSDKALREQAPDINAITDEFIAQIGKHGETVGGTDLERWLNMCMFDITGKLAFGEDFQALQNGASMIHLLRFGL